MVLNITEISEIYYIPDKISVFRQYLKTFVVQIDIKFTTFCQQILLIYNNFYNNFYSNMKPEVVVPRIFCLLKRATESQHLLNI